MAATSDCIAWAVGKNDYNTLIERWNGTAWTVQTSRDPGEAVDLLNGVAGSSPTNAWAVGDSTNDVSYDTLIEHWDGTAWTVQPTVNPGTTNYLEGVSATASKNAWAVGYYYSKPVRTYQALIEHLDGTAWTVQPGPHPRGYARDIELYGVAATSSKNVWAVGYYSKRGGVSRPLIEHWNGKAWRIQRSPRPSRYLTLVAVAATSSKSAWAVGTYYGGYRDKVSRTLIEHWNGKAWKIQRSSNPGGSARDVQLDGVTVTSSKSAWAVGYYNPYKRTGATRALIEHWNGKAWKIQRSSHRGRTRLVGVAATSPTNAWTVGSEFHNRHTTHVTRILALHWDGSAWKG